MRILPYFVLAIGLASSAANLRAQNAAPAQSFLPVVVAEKPHARDKAFWAMVGTDALLNGLDGWTTSKLLSYPYTYERDPILGRHPSSERIATTFAVKEVIGAVILHELEKHHHGRVAKLSLAGAMTVSTYCVINNFSIMKQRGY